MKRILLCLSTALFTFLIGIFLPLIYSHNQDKSKASPVEFNEKLLSILLTKQNTMQSKEIILKNEDKLTHIGCWNGGRGGRLKITVSKVFDLGSKENSNYYLFSVGNFDDRNEIVLKASKKYWRSFLSKFIKISFFKTGVTGITSYKSKEDLLADNFSGAGQFERVRCK